MEQRLSPIKLDSYQPLREVVCESLREAIRKGVLRPGERIMEIKLAEELGVSRTPVREAIRKLELEGYVVMMPRRGTYVADMSIRDINEIFEIRTALESLSNSLAAEHITEDELEHLQRLLVIIGGYIKEFEEGKDREGAMEKIVETDIEFHDFSTMRRATTASSASSRTCATSSRASARCRCRTRAASRRRSRSTARLSRPSPTVTAAARARRQSTTWKTPRRPSSRRWTSRRAARRKRPRRKKRVRPSRTREFDRGFTFNMLSVA